MKNSFETNKNIFEYFLSGGNKACYEFYPEYLENNNLLDYKNVLSGMETAEYTRRLKDTAKIIRIFSEIERKTKTPFFAMKSFLNFPFVDDDIDFVVAGGGYKNYTRELKSRGFYHKLDYADIREPLKRRLRHKDYTVMPHLHSEVSWNGVITCDKEEVLQNAVMKEIDGAGFRIPSATDELLVATGHFLFENYHFKMGDLLYIKYLLEGNIDYCRIRRISEEFGYSKGADLFFEYLKGISDCYNLNLNVRKGCRRAVINAGRPFPYYIPYIELIPVYAENFFNGMIKHHNLNPARRLFTYTLVGYLWKYVLPIGRQRKCLSHSQD